MVNNNFDHPELHLEAPGLLRFLQTFVRVLLVFLAINSRIIWEGLATKARTSSNDCFNPRPAASSSATCRIREPTPLRRWGTSTATLAITKLVLLT